VTTNKYQIPKTNPAAKPAMVRAGDHPSFPSTHIPTRPGTIIAKAIEITRETHSDALAKGVSVDGPSWGSDSWWGFLVAVTHLYATVCTQSRGGS
jgi:hypothetical protein